MTTVGASLGTGEPAVNVADVLALLGGDPFENLQKLPESQIANLATPKPLHSLQVQCLEVQHIKLVGQCVRQLPEPVTSATGNIFMSAN